MGNSGLRYALDEVQIRPNFGAVGWNVTVEHSAKLDGTSALTAL